MRAILLGGYGQFGLPTARHLVRYDAIEEVIIAGRNLEKAQEAAAKLGPKAGSLSLDAGDAEAVAASLGAGDILVSFMWDMKQYQEPLIQAAINTGAHYGDLRSRAPAAELDSAAREAGVTALIGLGSAPGLTGLMAKLAFSLLDQVDHAVSGFNWSLLLDIWDDIFTAYFKLPGGLDRGPNGRQLRVTLGAPASHEARLAAIRDGRVAEFFLYLLSGNEPPKVQVPAVRQGILTSVDPLIKGIDIPSGAPGGGYMRTPVVAIDPPGEKFETAHNGFDLGGFAQPFTELVHQTAARLRAEELDFETAAAGIYEQLAAGLDPYLLEPELFAAMPGYFMTAYGTLDGHQARAATWMPQPYYREANWLDLTAANVALSVKRLIGGDIVAPGVHNLAEVDALDDGYLVELESMMPEAPAGVPLVDKSVEFLM